MFITCDFCVLSSEFHVLFFLLCSVLYVLSTMIFSLEGAINSKCADAEMEKERAQRDKIGNMNNVAFYAVISSSPYGY